MLNTFSLGHWACDPVRVKATRRFDAHRTKSQLPVDNAALQRYSQINRARHASQRCAPGGTFFARSTGIVALA